MDSKKCPKCDGEMADGVIAPLAPGVYKRRVVWKMFWGKRFTGSTFWGEKLEDAEEFTTYKCRNCGYLENYAK